MTQFKFVSAVILALGLTLSLSACEGGAKNVLPMTESSVNNTVFGIFIVQDETNDDVRLTEAEAGNVSPGKAYVTDSDGHGFIIEGKTVFTGKCLKSFEKARHPNFDEKHPNALNYPVLNFEFSRACAKHFGEYTKANVGKRMAIVINGTVVTAPLISAPIKSGSGFIEGGFTDADADNLVNQLSTELTKQ